METTARRYTYRDGLHPNHGKPCANTNCKRPLVTGKIHAGIYCNRHQCGPRGLAGRHTAHRKGNAVSISKPVHERGQARAALSDISNAGYCAPVQYECNSDCDESDSDDNISSQDALHEQRELHGMDDETLAVAVARIATEAKAAKRQLAHMQHKLKLAIAVQSLRASQLSRCASAPVPMERAVPTFFFSSEGGALPIPSSQAIGMSESACSTPRLVEESAMYLIGTEGPYEGQRLAVNFNGKGTAMIGRSAACSLQLELDSDVSDLHLQILMDPQSGSFSVSAISHGTLLNDKQIEPFRFVILKEGDAISFGHSVFRVKC